MRFEPLLYVLAFTQKDFYYTSTGPPTQGSSTEDLANANLGIHNSSLQQKITSTKRQDTKPKQQSLLHKRDKALRHIAITSHKRNKALSHTTISSTLEG